MTTSARSVACLSKRMDVVQKIRHHKSVVSRRGFAHPSPATQISLQSTNKPFGNSARLDVVARQPGRRRPRLHTDSRDRRELKQRRAQRFPAAPCTLEPDVLRHLIKLRTVSALLPDVHSHSRDVAIHPDRNAPRSVPRGVATPFNVQCTKTYPFGSVAGTDRVRLVPCGMSLL